MRRFRAYWPDDDEWHWLELTDALEPARHIVFRSGIPIIAADAALAVRIRDLSEVAFHVYAAHFGEMAYGGPIEAPPGALPVSAAEYSKTYHDARHVVRPVTSGPFGPGAVVPGTFRGNPWPHGRTGTRVDLGHDPLAGFVDAKWFFHAAASWPAPGTHAEFTVIGFEPDGLQLQLRPAAVPSGDVEWPGPRRW